MAEPLLKIVARFDINEEPGLPLEGRAYLSGYNFQQAYKSDLVYAVRILREVIKSPELNPARQGEFKHTIALMWELPSNPTNPREPYHQMIDFLAWNFIDWEDNAEIFGWQTKDGEMLQPKFGIYPVTCEGGTDILHAEKDFRRFTQMDFMKFGPNVTSFTGLKPDYDFCKPDGRERLKRIMQRDRFIIL